MNLKLCNSQLHDTATSSLPLSSDQLTAYQNLTPLPCLSNALTGFSGTGKTTTTKAILSWHTENGIPVYLTATTNKAVAVLAKITGHKATTWHSLFKLNLIQDGNGGHKLKQTRRPEIECNSVIFIDEASMLNHDELNFILNYCRENDLKVLFIGDPYQLLNVKGRGAPALTTGDNICRLTTPHRQDDHSPIYNTAQSFREVLEGKPFPEIKHAYAEFKGICVIPNREQFEALKLQVFTNHRNQNAVRSLHYANEDVLKNNKNIHQHLTGSTSDAPRIGDYMRVNSAIVADKKTLFSTDEQVEIVTVETSIQGGIHGYSCLVQGCNNSAVLFVPQDWEEAKIHLKDKKSEGLRMNKIYEANPTKENDRLKRLTWRYYYEYKNSLADLRRNHASTIHKSQGDTFEYVFINLDEIGTCTVPETISRLLYVAVSRASECVFITGQLPERLANHNMEVTF